MATFLVNSKMHPALAARIEASISGGKRMRGRPRPMLVAFVRIAFFVALALFVWTVATTRKPDPQMMRSPASKAPAPALSR